jgi:predicted ribosome quality control (RQC) complex YloA/Tae2 family protein
MDEDILNHGGLPMPLDAPVIARLAQEITSRLPVKIDKIHQPYRDEFLFSCYGGGESFKLLLCLNAQYGRFHTFASVKINPPAPTSFCMLLRKHCGGAKLTQVTAVPFERVVCFTFEGYDPLHGLSHKHIWLELTGKSANLILANEAGEIIDTWRKVNSRPGERELSSGRIYRFPSTKGRWAPVTVDREHFTALLASLPETVTLEQFLPAHWYGLSGPAVREIIHAAGLTPQMSGCHTDATQSQMLFDSFGAWSEPLRLNSFQPCGIFDCKGTLLDYTAFPVNFPPGHTFVRPLTSLDRTVGEFVESLHESARFREAQRNLTRKIGVLLDKARKKLSKQEAEAEQAEKGDEWRIRGELLTIYGFQIPKGGKEVRLANHYHPEAESVSIPLNPALTAQENAQAYFKKYQKAKKGQLAIAAQLQKTAAAIEYLESLETMAAGALTLTDLELVKEELEPERRNGKKGKPGLKPTKKAGSAPAKESAAKPRQFLAPAGHQILVGRNNLQNDKLTFKIGAPGDLWFHTQKIPGSHVILKAQPGLAVDDETLNYACQIAVYFSKGRKSTKVPVDYTVRKNVKKPPAAPPGFVIYDYFKTAIITPDREILTKLGLPVE